MPWLPRWTSCPRRTSDMPTPSPDAPLLAVTLGDPAGVGAEVVVKALADVETAALARVLIVGDLQVLRAAERTCGVTLPRSGRLGVRHIDALKGRVPPPGRL